jgi:hypothetical protein
MATIWGIVKYRDTFASNLELLSGTGFAPGNDVRLERLVGYPGYNENT